MNATGRHQEERGHAREEWQERRFAAIVDATEVGVWAFHCHTLSHAESEHGMFGMVTALIVQE
jgi:FtsP/CotA-like multicopper oxidase with cupredoxin domain